jgi:hypothetical protein
MGAVIDWSPPTRPSFRYDTLGSDVADRLRQQAERIRLRIARTAQDMIETGQDLAAVKAHTDHGLFTAWVESECGITPRLAQMYMRAAEWVSDKSEIVSLLQPTAILKLSAKSTPDDVRANVLEKVRAGERVQVSQIDAMLYNAREDRKERERLERMSPKARKKREAKRLEQAKWAEERRSEELARRDRQSSMADELAAIIVSNVSPDRIDRVIEIMRETELFEVRYDSGVRSPSLAVRALQNLLLVDRPADTAITAAADRAEARSAGRFLQ